MALPIGQRLVTLGKGTRLDLRSYRMDVLGFGHYRVCSDSGKALGTVEWLKSDRWLATTSNGRQLGHYHRIREACAVLADAYHRSRSTLPHVVGDLLASTEAAGSQPN